MKITFIFLICYMILNSCNTDSQQEIKITSTKNSEQIDSTISIEIPLVLDLTDTTQFKLAELASVNSHHLSSEELQYEKNKIFNIQLSVKHFEWKNPTSGGAVHINKDDNIEIYNCIWMRSALDSTFKAPNSTFKEIEIDKLWHYVQGVTYGNAPCVLVTSEYDIHKSKSIKIVIEELFKHTAQIYYIEGNE